MIQLKKQHLLAIAFSFLFSTGSALAAAPMVDVELRFKNTTDMKDFSKLNLEKIIQHKFKIIDFKDNRSAPLSRVGLNMEKVNQPLTVDTKSNVADFVTDSFTTILKKAGLDIAKTGEDLTLTADINDFMVNETNTYMGNLTLRIRIAKGEKVIWQGVVTGTSSHFGRSYKLDNYLEVMSDSIVDATLNLLKNEDLKSRMRSI